MSRQAGFHSPSAQLLSLLGGRVRPDDAPSQLLGVEHEYTLTDGDTAVDFRQVLRELQPEGTRLDPGDANAYRLDSGIALTCDDAEAEVALPPVALRPGFTHELAALNATAQSQLATLLPAGLSVRGYSTHVSAAMPVELGDAACQLYAATFAPALMLLADRRDAYGIFLRPRPRRFEVCSEYIEGTRLGAVATFVAGSVRACASQLSGNALDLLPPAIEVMTWPADSRFGLYVGRRAFGTDLYEGGRGALLNRREGGTISAQKQLELAWQAARGTLVTSVEPAELRAVDSIVRASGQLPVEPGLELTTPAIEAPSSSVFGSVTQPRRRSELTIAATLATWDFTVFEVASTERKVYASIPREYLVAFLRALDEGRLDGVLASALHRPAGNRILENRSQTAQPGLWDRVGEPRDLLARERSSTGAIALAPLRAGDRAGKPPPLLAAIPAVVPPSRRQLSPLFLLLLVLFGAAAGAAGYLLTNDNSEPATAVVASRTPSATATVSATLAPSPSPTVVVLATAPPAATAIPPTATAVAPTATVAPATVAPPTATPIPPTATPVPPNLVEGVGPIAAVFDPLQQATTYTVLNPTGGITFSWSVSEACGGLAGTETNGFTWTHPHPPCDATNHAGAVVQVVVSDGANSVRCSFAGASTGVGTPCEPI